VINLAGRSVNCRYTAKHRREMMDSRIESTRVLGQAIAACRCPPRVWLNSSTATIYRHTFGPPHDELSGEIGASAEAHDAFSIKIATAWENAFFDASAPRTRRVAMRTAIVLADIPGNMVRILKRLTRLGLGGAMGSGKQYVSWIHAFDFCHAVEFLIENEELSGPVNLAAPTPITNREIMWHFRRVLGMPFGLPASQWMLEAGAWLLRTETELILKSRRVVSRKLPGAGFQFRFTDVHTALEDLLGGRGSRKHAGPAPSHGVA